MRNLPTGISYAISSRMSTALVCFKAASFYGVHALLMRPFSLSGGLLSSSSFVADEGLHFVVTKPRP